ncbi:Inner membrane protein [Chitinispirillum alkaliphilum]|nr:Inner membrane protein [Chitinispirillum alkaliphilum]
MLTTPENMRKLFSDLMQDSGAVIQSMYSSENSFTRKFIEFFAFWKIVFTEYSRNHYITRASAIAFVLLLTFIPLIATAAFMFASITEVNPEQVEHALKLFLPFAPQALMQHINTFFVNAQSLRGIGIGVLIFMAVGLFGTVEEAFNSIYKVVRARSFFVRLRTFTMVMVYSPILFLASFQFRRSNWFEIGSNEFIFLEALPFLLTALAFTVMIWFIPNTKVRFRSALLGGILACLLFELEKWGFGYYVKISMQTHIIYGTFGILPFFLVSLFFAAILLLFGAQVAYVHQNFRPLLRTKKWDRPVEAYRNYLLIRMLIDCVRAFIKKTSPPTIDYFCKKYELTQTQANRFVQWLIEQKFIYQVDGVEAFVPARDFSTLSVRTVYEAIEDQNRYISYVPDDFVRKYIEKNVIGCRDDSCEKKNMSFLTLVEILETGEKNEQEIACMVS